MKFYIFIVLLSLNSVSHADLQSEFQVRLESISKKKTVTPDKIKMAQKLIEKKLGSSTEKIENIQSDPYQMNSDSQKYLFYIDQLIFIKLKDKTICRGQLETFQNQPIYQGLRVICLGKKNKVQTFEETL